MRHNYYLHIENLTTELSNIVHDTKTKYHNKLAAKLVISSASAKILWSILKTFANDRKAPVIPPLLINNEFIPNSKTKATYFNRLFYQRFTAISTNSSITSSVNLARNETPKKTMKYMVMMGYKFVCF